jgi:hypothetical protein
MDCKIREGKKNNLPDKWIVKLVLKEKIAW